MIKLFNIAKKNKIAIDNKLKYLGFNLLLQNSIIGMENNIKSSIESNNILKKKDNKIDFFNAYIEKNNIEDVNFFNFSIFLYNINELKKIIYSPNYNINDFTKDFITNIVSKSPVHEINEMKTSIEKYPYKEILFFLEKIKKEDEYKEIYQIFSDKKIYEFLPKGKFGFKITCFIPSREKKYPVKYVLKFIPYNLCEQEKIPYKLKENIGKDHIGYNNIVDIIEIYENKNKLFDILKMPYCTFTDLNYFFKFNRLKGYSLIKDKQTATLYAFNQIIAGYSVLFENRILHKDLKPDNIFIDDDFFFKISDFSLSFQYEYGKKIKLTNSGTLVYMPPESLNSVEVEYKNINKVDMFSIGCILYEIFYDKSFIPIEYNDEKYKLEIINEINNNYFVIKETNENFIRNLHLRTLSYIKDEEFIDYRINDLLLKLLNPNIKNRASFKDIITSNIYKTTNILSDEHLEWIKKKITKKLIKKII